MGSGRRRLWLAVAAAAVVGVGLVVHFVARGPVAAPVGDALYAVMAYLLVAVLLPRSARWFVALISFAGCTAIELFQLTPVPAALAVAFPPSSLVFGTTFAAGDLAAYAVGVAVAAVADSVTGMLASTPGRRESGE